MSDEAIMLVLLVNDYLDSEFKIRTKLGHSFSTHLWNQSTFAKVIKFQYNHWLHALFSTKYFRHFVEHI